MESTKAPAHLGISFGHLVSIFAELVVGLAIVQSASAQTSRNFTGTTAGTYDWSDQANWVGGQVPDTAGEIAVFNATGNTFSTGGLITVNQDIAGVTVGGIQNSNVTSSGTLVVSGLGVNLNDGTGNQVGVTAGGNAQVPIYAIDMNVTDPNGIFFTAQNNMIVNGNVTTLSTGTIGLNGGGSVFLGGTNNLNGHIAPNFLFFIATSTAAFGGNAVLDFGNGTAEVGIQTQAAGTTTVGYAINTGTKTGNAVGINGARMTFASGTVGSTLNLTTSTFTNQAVGDTAFSIQRSTSETQTPNSIGTVMFSGTGFDISRTVMINGDHNSGNATAKLEFNVATGAQQTWSGSIISVEQAGFQTLNANGPIVVKSGGGTVVLSGNNNYVWQTGVTAGTMLINGTHTSSYAPFSGRNGYGDLTTGNTVVNSAAILGGSGRIAMMNTQDNSNMVLVQSGGRLAPGPAAGVIGTLTFDGGNFSGAGSKVLNMALGSGFTFELDGSGGAADNVSFWNYVNGDVLLSNNAIDFTLTGAEASGTYTVALFRFYSDNGATATASGVSSGLSVGALGANIGSATLIYNANYISLQYTVVPEPSTSMLVLISAGAIFAAVGRRRRLARS